MFSEIRYLALGGRRPVRLPGWYPGQDVQGCIPPGWCLGCGTELFAPGEEMCDGCIRKEYGNYEKRIESVLCMHAGS